MKRRHFIISFLFITSFIFAQGKSLTIATFNCEFLTRPKVHIKFGLPFNLKYSADSVKQKWENPDYLKSKFTEAAKAVATVIKQTEADVIGLTEVGSEEDIKILVSELKKMGVEYNYYAVCNSRDYTTKQYVAILSKFELKNVVKEIPGRESYLAEPDDPDSEDDTGISKGMRAEFEVEGYQFFMYVLHLSSERGGHEKDMQRISQASIARRHMLSLLEQNANIIVCGDFNDKRGQPAIRRIRGLDDIQPDLIQTGFPKYFDDDKLDTRWTYEYQGVKQQIDNILLSYGIKSICKRSGIHSRTIDHNNDLASDHNPLIVKLNLR